MDRISASNTPANDLNRISKTLSHSPVSTPHAMPADLNKHQRTAPATLFDDSLLTTFLCAKVIRAMKRFWEAIRRGVFKNPTQAFRLSATMKIGD